MNTKYPKGDQASDDFGASEVIVDIFFQLTILYLNLADKSLNKYNLQR